MNYMYINSIRENPSLCDGKGYRTVLFVQGCNLHCKGCHNQSSWNMKEGKKYEIRKLAQIIREKCFNKELTISGGEPLMQPIALEMLFEELKDFDLCLYTGHEESDVPESIKKYLTYLKVGPYVEELRTTVKPFVGSTNQRFMEVKHDETK